MVKILEKKSDSELICGVLSLLRHATLLHEFNRQNIMNAEIMKSLQPLLKSDSEEVFGFCLILYHFSLSFLLFIAQKFTGIFCFAGAIGDERSVSPSDSRR